MDSQKRNRTNEDQIVNAAPGDEDSLALPRPPKNIAETPAWKASQRGASRLWTNYRMVLATSFERMSREEQEALVRRLCMIITIGVTFLGLLMFYSMMPLQARVFGVPLAVVGAWWVSVKVVTPVVLARLADLLNKQ